MSAATVHLEIPADDVERVSAFYSGLMGWRTEKLPGMDYTMVAIDAGEGACKVTGGIMPRQNAEHKGIMPYFGVSSVAEYESRIAELGGKVLTKKTAVPGYGYFVICRDTERNKFALWEEDKTAE